MVIRAVYIFLKVDGIGMIFLGLIGAVKSFSLASAGNLLPDLLGGTAHGAESTGISQWLPPWVCLPASQVARYGEWRVLVALDGLPYHFLTKTLGRTAHRKESADVSQW